MSLRILIADDNPLVRYGVRVYVEGHGGWAVCGEAGDGLETIEKAVSLKPDLVLLDISMPNLDGIDAASALKEKVPGLGIIILTLHESLDLARVASRAGAWGYVTKSLISTDLLPTIEAFESAMPASGAN
ncbi:MAG TPA: response regulator transcription factor [Candidatus Baltobacteraceae bacterium]|jgi:DNA-binding NarL/FixJ family response regulator|nr:response regulator transcription factor [Candidatus Baltobacteraceae bacterium]